MNGRIGLQLYIRMAVGYDQENAVQTGCMGRLAFVA